MSMFTYTHNLHTCILPGMDPGHCKGGGGGGGYSRYARGVHACM